MTRALSVSIALTFVSTDLFAAEAGMPQLDPKYWASQAFWLILIFGILYFVTSKIYLPKIRNNLDTRENKIKDDLDNANKFKEQSEEKLKEYENILLNAKKDVAQILFDSKNTLDKDIKLKKEKIEKEIENEVVKAQIEITELKKNSVDSIQKISREIALSLIENISGDKLNESSIKAVVEDVSKKKIGKYL